VLTIDITYHTIQTCLVALRCRSLSLYKTSPKPLVRILTHTRSNLLLSTTYSSPTHYIFIHRNRARNPNSLSQNPNGLCMFFLPLHLHVVFPSLALNCCFPAFMLNCCFPSFFCACSHLCFDPANCSLLCFCARSSKLSYSNYLSNRYI
jgi:hypothetical protein